MSTMREDRANYRISVVDEDPLRARRESRELLAVISADDPAASLDAPNQRASADTDKGGVTAEALGLVFNAGSLVAAGVQIWLARVPQRTVIISRPDGATLRITGKEARADAERIDQFLKGGGDTRTEEIGDGEAAG